MRPNLNPLHTSFPHHHHHHPRPQDQTSPTRSPTSPATTASISSPSPPTSPFYYSPPRRLHHHHHPTHPRGRLPTRDRHDDDPLPSHPPHHAPSTPGYSYSASPSPSSGPRTRTSPFRLSARSLSRPIFLRRRPSRAEVALSEERWRAREDQIERLGLQMLEPRPAPPNSWAACADADAALGIGGFAGGEYQGMGMSMDGAVEMDYDAGSGSGSPWERTRLGGGLREQRVVMGGIFEVMEGRG
ncbi:hypothetical protein P170DRAFT_441245 [Aspergillus steynii IBT 23096]|uniref:Uncharacterized protein n=1 Tax=Aspergillus steynii IBT 23096 TaxID=1392250 RepID=A0A2I2FT27_9EURO|nr:uncharacterized protein P170DRAFT_441245 [Aspergillus steynii IBT 23096]PLB43790.1 hypothetical protein P170DRAFT_441245 [Aspergillus steynii IBT 23096]